LGKPTTPHLADFDIADVIPNAEVVVELRAHKVADFKVDDLVD
jgi:hypothetical protein